MKDRTDVLLKKKEYAILEFYGKIYDIFLFTIISTYRSNEPFVSTKLVVKRYLKKEYY